MDLETNLADESHFFLQDLGTLLADGSGDSPS
jgi:hypothetical protein